MDRLLTNIVVIVEPFALCLLSSGWALQLPGPPDVMFHFVLQGSGALRGPRELLTLYPYCLAVVPAGTQHALECGGQVKSVRAIDAPPEGPGIHQLIAGSPEVVDLQVACGIVHVSLGDSLGLFSHMRDVVVADLSHYPQVRSAFEGIIAEQGQRSSGSNALTTALMTQCLVYLLRHLIREPDPPLPWLSALEDPGLARAVEVIFENPAAGHTVDSLADEALMSRSTFAERFHAAFGVSPMAFIRDIRMRRAAAFLQQSSRLSIDQVARRVGFSSRSHFVQAFRDRFGVSPSAYRVASSTES